MKSKPKSKSASAIPAPLEREILQILYAAHAGVMAEKQKKYLVAQRERQTEQDVKEGRKPSEPLPHAALYLSELLGILTDVNDSSIVDPDSFYKYYAPDLFKRKLIKPLWDKDKVMVNPDSLGLLKVFQFPITLSDKGVEYCEKFKKQFGAPTIGRVLKCSCGNLALDLTTGETKYYGTRAKFKPGTKQYKIVYGLLASPTHRLTYEEIIASFYGKKLDGHHKFDENSVIQTVKYINQKLGIIAEAGKKLKKPNPPHFRGGGGYSITC